MWWSMNENADMWRTMRQEIFNCVRDNPNFLNIFYYQLRIADNWVWPADKVPKLSKSTPRLCLSTKMTGRASRKLNPCWLSLFALKRMIHKESFPIYQIATAEFYVTALKRRRKRVPHVPTALGSSISRGTSPSLVWTIRINTVFQRFVSHIAAHQSFPRPRSSRLKQMIIGRNRCLVQSI